MAKWVMPVLGTAGTLLAATPQFVSAQTDAAPTVGDVVVTARQRPETTLSVPLAVRAVTAERIGDLRPVQLSDISGAAPNFSIERNAGVDTVFIRGAGGGGRNIGFDARTGVYLDGVYTARPGALNRSLADAERVEILRGPQGALFGRNTVSGAVDIISRQPGKVFGGEARAWGGSQGGVGGYVGVDIPLVGDKVLARVSALHEAQDGFTTNLFDRSRAGGSIDLGSYRVALRLQPSAALRLDLSADYGLDKSQRDGFEAVSNPVGAGQTDPYAPAPFQVNENTPRLRINEQYGTSLKATYVLPDRQTLTWISAYRSTRVRRRSDNDYSPLDLLSTDYRDRFGQISQEVRLASADEARLRYVLGGFYLHEEARSNRIVSFGSDTLLARLPVAPNGTTWARARINSGSLAAFANLDYQLAPRWSVSAGLRLNHEHRDLLFDLDGRQSGGFGIASLTGFRDTAGEGRATPSASLAYSPSPTTKLYVRYAEGFKSGGWNVDYLNKAQVTPLAGSTATPFAFGPEGVNAYEAGLKANLWGGRAHVEATAFLMDFRDYQINKFVAYPGGATVLKLTNASSARSSGLELSADLKAASFLTLTVDAGTLDARFGSFPGGGTAGADASGHRMPYAPKFSARLGVDISAPLDSRYGRLDLFLDERHKSFIFTGPENELTESVPSSNVINARLAWRLPGDRFEVALWSRNLGDSDYLTNSVRDFLGTRTVAHGDPRTYGVELEGRF